MSREHQDEFVECSCTKDQRESLINKLKSYGATNAEEGVYNNTQMIMYSYAIISIIIVKQVKFVDANYCVVKFSVVREVGSIVDVLKAFPVSQLSQ